MRYELELERMPNIYGTFSKVIFKGSQANEDANKLSSLSIAAQLDNFCAEPEHLAGFNKVIEWQGSAFPATYFQVATFPLALKLLCHKQFPFRALGIIHLSNTIQQFSMIPEAAPLTLTCEIGNFVRHKKGMTFDICSKVFLDDKTLWQAVATNLVRQNNVSAVKSTPHGEVMRGENTENLVFSHDIGRIYGKTSKDLNPIHLWPLTAKLFGFKRPIAHGMYSLARCASILLPVNCNEYEIAVNFIKPIYLPNEIQLNWSNNSGKKDFVMTGLKDNLLHLKGQLAVG